VKEEAAEQRALLLNALTQGFYSTGVELAVNIAASQQQLDQVSFSTTATSAQRAALASAFSSPQANSAANIQDFMVSDSDPFTDVVNLGISQTQAPTTWYSLTSQEINQIQGVELGIAQNIVARAQSLESGAQQSAIITAVVTLAVLLLVMLATFVVARSLVRPLRRLQAGALDIASVQLPERVRLLSESPESAAFMEVAPIDVVSEDEIGQVARAFDQVHAEAVRLAGEQALLRSSFNATFVNLSRRLQTLIERLARMIDALEQTEEDSDRLGSLFSMDHLVTRMRRSAENMQLMAGHESPRKRSEAIPLADVVRAASSEIEQYKRVTLNIPPGVSVIGQAVSDIAHLLAELIENATIFSPKDTLVHVSVRELSSGGALIEIVDKGIGVSEGRLKDMNWRLDNPPTMDVSVSKHMGLFAVAWLAERHRVRVRLRPATPQGLSALVWLPESVIERTGRYYSVQSRSAQSSSAQAVVGARGAGADVAIAIDEGPAAPAPSGYAGNQHGGNADSAMSGLEKRTATGWFRRPAAAADGGPAPDQTVRRVPGESLNDSPLSGRTSPAGLPVRIPRASQLPGTETGAPTGPTGPIGLGGGSHALPTRSPDEARSSLSAFRRGTQRAEEKPVQSGQFGREPGAGEVRER
jgi:signal transduction histidine kinase